MRTSSHAIHPNGCYNCGGKGTVTVNLETANFKGFANGMVYCLRLSDGKLIETTDTFLPYYTKNAINEQSNTLKDTDIGSRKERWMIGVSVMSGCPVRCKFCATGQMRGWRNLTAGEIIAQVEFIINKNGINPKDSQEFKINYTRMGEPGLNLMEVKDAIAYISKKYPNTHHYVSTIGIKGVDYSWVTGNITLQLSLHSLNEDSRNNLIPYPHKLTIEELGMIRTTSNLKTTLNLSLVNESDFDIDIIKKYFDPKYFFIKLSPINPNTTSEKNHIGSGVIVSENIL